MRISDWSSDVCSSDLSWVIADSSATVSSSPSRSASRRTRVASASTFRRADQPSRSINIFLSRYRDKFPPCDGEGQGRGRESPGLPSSSGGVVNVPSFGSTLAPATIPRLIPTRSQQRGFWVHRRTADDPGGAEQNHAGEGRSQRRTVRQKR